MGQREATFDDQLNFTVGGLMELIGTFAPGPAMHRNRRRPAPIFGPPEPPRRHPAWSSWNAKRAGGVNNGDVGRFVDFWTLSTVPRAATAGRSTRPTERRGVSD